MAGKRQHDRKPYKRHAHGSTPGPSSSHWRSSTNTGDNSEANESFISQMTNSVTGLFSKSWRISDWFKSKRNDYSPSTGSEIGSQGGDIISTHPEGESFIFTKTEMRALSFKPIYPEEGVPEDREPIASTSGATPGLGSRGSYPFLGTGHPIISSTPAPSTSNDVPSDMKQTIIIEEDPDIESLPELEDVSLIAHPGTETTLREDFDVEDKSSARLSTSAHYSLGGRPPLADRKRRRESFEDLSHSVADNEDEALSNSHHQTPSFLPQPGALTNKRPRFSLSTYSSPQNSSFMDSSSLFYPGRTMYGGASNFRRPKYTPNSSKNVPQAQVRVQNPNHTPEDGGLSLAAKRILDSLNKMSTPLTNAKRIPSSRPKTYLFDSPSYIADFHRHRPTLRADRTPGSTPPTTKLLTPSKAQLRENVSSLLESPSVPKTRSHHESISPFAVPNAVSKIAPQIPVSVIVTTKEDTRLQPPVQTPSFSFGMSAGPTMAIPKATFSIRAEVHSPPKEDLRKATSFKMRPFKKGSESSLEETVEVPDLPHITFPISSMPKIDFGLNKGATTAAPSSSTLDEIGMFQFSVPKILVSSPLDVLPDDSMDSLDDFIFRQPVLENEEGSSSQEVTFVGEQVHQPHSEGNERGTAEIPTPSSESRFTDVHDSNLPSAPPEDIAFTTASSWGNKFKPSKDSWVCDMCLLRNKSTDNSCVACQFPNPTNLESLSGQETKFFGSSAPPSYKPTEKTDTCTGGFGDFFKKTPSEWTCDVCMINNKNDADKCNACQSSKPGNKSSSISQPMPKVSSSSSDFGDHFKKSSSEWICDVCMVNNKNEVNQCIACQTFKPGTNVEWECSTCLVRNKFTTEKCLSCSTPSNQDNEDMVSKAMTGNFKFGVGTNSFKFGIPKADSGYSSTADFKFGVPVTTEASITGGSTNLKDTLGFKLSSSANNDASKTFSFGFSAQSPVATTTTSQSLTSTSSVSISKESHLNTTLISSVVSSGNNTSKAGPVFSSSFPGFSFKASEIKPKPKESPIGTKGAKQISLDSGLSSSTMTVSTSASVMTTIAPSFGSNSLPKELSKSSFLPTTASICSVIVTSPKAASLSVGSSTKFSSLTSSASGFSSPIPSTTFSPFSTPPTTSAPLPLSTSSTINSTLFSFSSSTSPFSTAPAATSTSTAKFSFGKTATPDKFSFGTSVSSPSSGQVSHTLISTNFKLENKSKIPSTASVPPVGTYSPSASNFSSMPTSSSSKLAFGGIPSSNVFSFEQSKKPGSHQPPSSSSIFSFGNTPSTTSSTPAANPVSTSSIFSFGSSSHSSPSSGFTFSTASTPSSFFSGMTGTSPFTTTSTGTSPFTASSTQTTTTNSTTPCFAFGQSQEKKNNAGFHFGQASAGTGSSNFNFKCGNLASAGQTPPPGMFSFQGSSSFTPRTNAGSVESGNKEISANAFSLPTENTFSILSSSNPPQNRVIKTAKRRGKK